MIHTVIWQRGRPTCWLVHGALVSGLFPALFALVWTLRIKANGDRRALLRRAVDVFEGRAHCQ